MPCSQISCTIEQKDEMGESLVRCCMYRRSDCTWCLVLGASFYDVEETIVPGGKLGGD